MNKEEFIQELEKLNIQPTKNQLEKLDIYVKFLLEYNKHTNLTAIKTEEDVYLKHFYDSLTITKVIDLTQEKTLLDIGTGAGFPGLVLKIFFPNLNIILVDSNNKKTKFLLEIITKLNVDKITVINQRIEDITPKYLNYFDVVTSRAVTSLPILTELSLPLVKKEKYFIPMKGSNKEEVEEGRYAITKMHGAIEDICQFSLPNYAGERTIIKVKKQDNTNIKDIRNYNQIIKKPLIK